MAISNYVFPYASALKRWLGKQKQLAGTPEAFDDWFNRFFEDGNTITVEGKLYDCSACRELM